MIQIDSIRVDVGLTLASVERLYSRRNDLVAQESAFLKENGIGLVVVDIPSIPLESAAARRVPRLAVGNFAWDWIYAAYEDRDARWGPIVGAIREEYLKTDLLLRLPFSEEMSTFPLIEDIPVVASPGRVRRSEMAAITGCDLSKKWILLSFTSLAWSERALDEVDRIREYEFFTVLPLAWEGRRNFHAIDRRQVPFSDVVASVDAVISKPGFGILSDCVVNRKPLIYADRTDFLEYVVLENAIRKYLKHVHIPADRLYRGELSESIERIWDRPAPEEELPIGGARIAARRIMDFMK